jgi:hypothetical protein
MINLYREVCEAYPKQPRFPACSSDEAHALTDRPLPSAFFELTPPSFAPSDPHARLMLEGEYSGTAVKVWAAEHTSYRDNLHDENRVGFTFVPLVHLLFQLMTHELRNSQKICKDQRAIFQLVVKTHESWIFFRADDILPGDGPLEGHISEERAADSFERDFLSMAALPA